MVRLPGILRISDPAPGHAIPVLADSPHSGDIYPADFAYACDKEALERYEDRAVDRLVAGFPTLGATLICAEAPRSYIDLNRAENDLLPEQVSSLRGALGKMRPHYARRGIGLVWLYADGQKIYERQPSGQDIQARIDTYYRPYYAALEDRAAAIKKKFGGLWHLNFHSMPRDIEPDIIIGNLDNRSCSPEFTALLESSFSAAGLKVACNMHYKGARLTELFGMPHARSESVQIEINKRLYLEDDILTINPAGFAALQRVLESVCKTVGNYGVAQCASPKTPENDAFSAASRSRIDTRLPSAASDVTP